MKSMKKTLLMCVCFALIAVIAISGTVAYLTADVAETPVSNIFTSGKIAVNLTEDTAVIGEGGITKDNGNGTNYEGVVPGDYLKKEVTLSNDGTIPAYVAVTVTVNNANEINTAIDEYYEAKNYTDAEIQAIYDYIFDGFGWNYTKVDAEGNALGMRLTITGDDMPEHTLQVDSVKTIDEYWLQCNNNWFKDTDTIIPFDGYYTTGMDKYELRYTYYLLLEAGESTTLFNGLNIPSSFNNDQMDMFDGLSIEIDAAAIQADNFSGNAVAAFTVLKAEQNNQASQTVVADNDTLKNALTKDDAVIVVDLDSDVTYDISAWSSFAMGGNATEYIIINGNGHTLTFNQKNSDWNNIATNGATLILNNVNITNSGYNDGPWNRHDINFACEVEMNNVSSDKAVALKNSAVLNNVSITDDSGVYGLWIQAKDIDVEINGLTITAERGIKIADEYIDAPAAVSLNVENAEFNTTKKAAILVTSTAGADITLKNVDIYNCAADPVNAVWVDEDRADYLDKVTVEGGSVIVEGQENFSRVTTNEEFKNAVDSGATVIALTDGNYSIPSSAANKTLTIAGSEKVVINATTAQGINNANITFNGVTIQGINSNYKGFQHTNSLTFAYCVIDSQTFLYANTVVFEHCEFNQTSADAYNVWTYGAKNITFTDCAINSAGKSILVYNEGGNGSVVTFNNCEITASESVEGKAAIEIDSSLLKGNDTYTIYINDTTATGFDEGSVSGNPLWNHKKGEKATVYVDGVKVN